MEKKILLLIDQFGSGGAQRQIVNVGKGLKERGYNIEFAIYYPAFTHFRNEVEEQNIPIHVLEKKSQYSPGVLTSLIKLYKKQRYGLVISFLDTPNFYAEIASKFTGIKCLVSERSTFPDPNNIPVKKRILCHFHRFANTVITNSFYHKESLLRAFPFLNKKTRVILNIVNQGFFDIYKSRNAAIATPVLCVGSVNANKNAKVIINALAILRDNSNVDLKVSWAGKISEQGYFDECEQLIDQLHLRQNWQWLGEVANIKEHHASHNVLIHASYFEGLPNAVCEAMASGMIVLGSHVCEHPALLSGFDAKLLFNPSDAMQLAEVIYGVTTMPPAKRTMLSAMIHKRAADLFSNQKVIDKFEEAIKNATIN
jgi:GalNAc-alpha-(1->4)-GalNAc-alpha-(1->3)-diNAcBac-PP-undecaprenol alpha-1,4-N-acetyl-D-galactosaminyltransferase